MTWTKSGGYAVTLRQQAAAWLAQNPEFAEYVEVRLAEIGTHAFRSTGAKELGSALLGIRKDPDNWTFAADPGVTAKIDEILNKDSFLKFERHSGTGFKLYLDEAVRLEIGKAVINSKWWAANAKAVRRAVKALKTVQEVQEE